MGSLLLSLLATPRAKQALNQQSRESADRSKSDRAGLTQGRKTRWLGFRIKSCLSLAALKGSAKGSPSAWLRKAPPS